MSSRIGKSPCRNFVVGRVSKGGSRLSAEPPRRLSLCPRGRTCRRPDSAGKSGNAQGAGTSAPRPLLPTLHGAVLFHLLHIHPDGAAAGEADLPGGVVR